MKSGWYPQWFDGCDNYPCYVVVKPINNGKRQQLVVYAQFLKFGRVDIALGVFPSICTFRSMFLSPVWDETASTNKNPNFSIIPIAVEALKEVEEEIKAKANGKRRIIYIDGMDDRRLRAYTKILNRYNCGYKVSSAKSNWIKDAHKLYKVI